ncbi:MAG: hypothetical protein ACHQ7N_06725 [Candidatus Methylomirabilales bacterium]
MGSETKPVALNTSQLRAVGAMLRLVEEAVDQIERLLIDPVTRTTFRLADDLDAEECRTIHAACDRLRAVLVEACGRLEIEVAGRSRRGVIRGEVSTLWAMVEDTKSPGLRGYGPLSPDAGRVVDEVLHAISTTLIGILRLVA